MSYAEQLQIMYLDYFNNYLTIEYFAQCEGLTKEQAALAIKLGREIHEGFNN